MLFSLASLPNKALRRARITWFSLIEVARIQCTSCVNMSVCLPEIRCNGLEPLPTSQAAEKIRGTEAPSRELQPSKLEA